MNEGTVISGTHRPQDLLPTFLIEVRTWITRNSADLWERYQRISRDVPHGDLLWPDSGVIVDDHPWWQSEECTEVIWDLMAILDDIAAPHGLYFGCHMGDGSDFGFWKVI